MIFKLLGASFVAAFLVAYIVASALADGNPDESSHVAATPNQASDASFDKRLPPVLPGEEVSDNGKPMKIWSTSGPVPVNNAATVGNSKSAQSGLAGIDKVDVIVDQRGREIKPSSQTQSK